jgi:integrase
MPWKQAGVWRAWVKDAAGINQKVQLTEARTREEAKRLEGELRMKARRQREGLDPMPSDPRLTLGVLLKWWIDTYVASRTSERQERDRFRVYFETSELARIPVARLDAGRIETFLQSWSGQLGPESTNKLRAMIRTAWNKGRKAGLLHGENPTKDVDRRKVPKRAPAFHEAHEVPRLLAQLSPTDRNIAAAALYAGLRKGELFGLLKTDVDLKRRLLTIRRSYDNETTKGAREEAVPIAVALVPYLEAALDASRGELLFPRPDGEMRTEADKLGKRIRTALKHAGIVDGYLHVCRRCKANGKPHEEKHPDNERRECPVCGMALWAKPIAKKLRLHDTRHTTATLLLGAGADLYAVARILRHTDPKVTFGTYAHLVPGYLHEQVDKLSFAVPPMGLAHLLPTNASKPLERSEVPSEKAAKNSDVEECVWQESNLRPAASKAAALSS